MLLSERVEHDELPLAADHIQCRGERQGCRDGRASNLVLSFRDKAPQGAFLRWGHESSTLVS